MADTFWKQTRSTYHNICGELLSLRNTKAYWEGELSSSALAVSVSVIAMRFYKDAGDQTRIRNGLRWLVSHNNPDGGFGDTPESLSNISTSLLCYSALHLHRDSIPDVIPVIKQLEIYLRSAGIAVDSEDLFKSVLAFYQKDLTFSVPILATCALCGIPKENPFAPIPRLPFLLALLPRSFYKFLNLNVVSYALPALIAVGIVIHKNKTSSGLPHLLREWATPRVLKLLLKLLPESGGFLEAIPLTAFVCMSLIKAGFQDNPVVKKGIDFLRGLQRQDGSWPIDINLSTWVTTLAVKGLKSAPLDLYEETSKLKLTEHLLSIQNKIVHPFNGTSPGGWGWTPSSGAVPDGDDTPGAILSLLHLNMAPDKRIRKAVLAGCNWLLDLQNSDGGFPTFSRGWSKLPFDQSCADLTGHAMNALSLTLFRLQGDLPPRTQKHYRRSLQRALAYLIKNQNSDGSWVPLWFGNQNQSEKKNPVYGTARVCAYLTDATTRDVWNKKDKQALSDAIKRARDFLIFAQNYDGSWGGDKNLCGTVEETSLAVSALAVGEISAAVKSGLAWLEKNFSHRKPAPIGLYFASLWYDDKLYPYVMYAEALERVLFKKEKK